MSFWKAVALTGAMAMVGTGYASAQDERTVRIAYSVDVLDQTQNVILQSVQRRVDEINASDTGVKVELSVYDAQSSVDKQISDVQAALIKQPDVLIFSAVDHVGSQPAALAAKEAGVLILDRRPARPVAETSDVAFYGSEEGRYTKATTDWIRAYLDANPDTVLKIGAIYGNPAQTPQLLRIDAIKALAEEMPDRMEMVIEGYGNWLTETAQNMSQDWLIANPQINYIAVANSIMAQGVANTLEANGRTDILVSAYDLTPESVQRVKNGTQSLTVGTSLADNGQMVDVAIGMVDGTFTEKAHYLEPVYAIDSTNVDEFMSSQGQ